MHTNFQLTVDLHLSFLELSWATWTQLWGRRHTIIVMMGLLWRERWKLYAEQIEDGAPLQSADQAQVVYVEIVNQITRIKCQ